MKWNNDNEMARKNNENDNEEMNDNNNEWMA
jgi:hypothetical protein